MAAITHRASSLLCLFFLAALATSNQAVEAPLKNPLSYNAFSLQSFNENVATRLFVNTQTHKDLWRRIRDGFSWETAAHNPRVRKQIQAFLNNPGAVEKIAKNAAPFLYLIVAEIERRGMPMELALLPMVESRYEPNAKSPVGASGLWQIMPATGRHLGLKHTAWYDGRKDIQASTEAALKYLDFFNTNNVFDGDWLLSLAAYNAGEGSVRKAMRRNSRTGKPKDYWNLPLPQETKDYVPKLLALATILSNPEKYNLDLPHLPNHAHLASVTVDAHTKLTEVMKLANMSAEQFYQLNPGFTRAARPNQDYEVLLPIENARLLELNLGV